VFIDLGMSYSLKGAKNQSDDANNFLRLVRQITDRAKESDDLDCVWFKRMPDIDTSVARSKFDLDKDLVGIWGSWKDAAEEARSGRKELEVDRNEKLFGKVAQRKRRVTDDDVLNAALSQT
jgi:hypothetical protein